MCTSSGHDSPPAWQASRSQSRQRCCTSLQSSTPVATTFSSSRISVARSERSRFARNCSTAPARAAETRSARFVPFAVSSSVTTRASCPCPRPQEPVVLEPVDEPHGARVGEAEHAGEVIDGAAAVDAERRQRGRPGSGVAGGIVDRRLHRVRDRHRHRAENVLEPGVTLNVHE